MKYLLFILIFFFTAPANSFCQSWFDNNPQWVNRFFHAFKGPGTEFCTITTDTVVDGIQGKICSRLRAYDNYPALTFQRFVYQSGDSIFCREVDRNILLYDMSLQEGESMVIESYYYDTLLIITIDHTGTINLNGEWLRTQEFTGFRENFPNGLYKGRIIEKIGAVSMQYIAVVQNDTFDLGTHFFLNEPNNLASDGIDWRFCQYSNNQFEFMQTGGTCNILTSAQPESSTRQAVTIFPNPATGEFFYRHFNADKGSITIVSQDGRVVLQTTSNSESRVDISALPPGIFAVHFMKHDQNEVIKLVVRQ